MARTETLTTTVRLPRRIYDQAKRIVEKERKKTSRAMSLNDLVVAAVRSYLQRYTRKEIDAAFAGMTEDAEYHAEAQALTAEFAVSDWEALKLADAEESR